MLKFEADQIGELYIRREFTYQFGLVRNNTLEISMGLREALKKEKKVDALVKILMTQKEKRKEIVLFFNQRTIPLIKQ